MFITLPDGEKKEFEKGISVGEVTKSISEGLYRDSVGAKVNDKVLGNADKINEDSTFKVLKLDDLEGQKILWHSASHLMAYAIETLYPNTKFAIGPAIDSGFYYDMDLDHRFVEEDFQAIEKKMIELAREDLKIVRVDITRDAAIKYFKEKGQDYKVELIEDLAEDEPITLYQMGEFTDLCRGPHLESTKKIKAVKLLSTAGAYWRGDSNNKMLQRIYGIAFDKKKKLDEFIEKREEAEKRDHRKLGRELDLFSMHEEGPGFPFFHPNGMIIRNNLLSWWKNVLQERGYGEILTPVILNEDLWHRSGHWDHYKENMYFTEIDEEGYAVKPMNCPGSTLIYSTTPHSYRDLPLRYAEFGLVHRHELSGALHGLFRVRSFTQDDAHIYCLPNQIKSEVFEIIDLANLLYDTFGFKYSVELSTRPDDYMGDLESWNEAEKALKEALEEKGMPYTINEGDGAFYGPKIDYHLEDAIGRTWQCGTIQLDFQLPQNFELTYVAEDGSKKRPVMLHRALFGSVERFMGILIEHFAGKFPLWLSPVQVEIIPVSEKFKPYAGEVFDQLKKAGIRVKIDERAEKVGYKIREAQLKKVNYMLVIGEKETASHKLSVRKRSGEEVKDVEVSKFIEDLKEEIKTKAIVL
ncbi:threonine--tRNA ligase [Peptoniphilus lacrimalis]|uniref:threonine--tRNA ligase n=1 Tax=Peptoniphilus lacrimalis TaxID=33031 RepID=UPI00254EA9CA|nr:threonine--tRNA ligase [Peptoniphilus lacrimalis]MDK7722743.1 threonine--tRNA ligase [Peptoniphilus lacrimalis]MDK7732271.1 threonine--tRNA ligase [Peptoniphilus lacrimalis]